MTPRVIAALVVVGVLAAGAIGLYWKGRADGVAYERPKVTAAAAQARIAGLETRGERETAQRVEVVVRQQAAAARTVDKLAREALSSEDAHAPLDARRLARLRAHDRELCLASRLAGCPAASDAAAGDEAVRDLPASRARDTG